MGADFVKVYTKLPREAYLAIVDEAKKQGLPLAGHVPESISAAEASDWGQKSIEHLAVVRRQHLRPRGDPVGPGERVVVPEHPADVVVDPAGEIGGHYPMRHRLN